MIPLLALLIYTSAQAEPCEEEAYAAEQRAAIPPGLLVAIGRVESGRPNDEGRVTPWPWSVNAAGEGHYLASSAEAIDFVRLLQSRGIRSIDVGCFQVNLLYHPEAFSSLAESFDPARNAEVAAQFLRRLRDTASNWEDAIARYHSLEPALGIPYMNQVLAAWHWNPASKPFPISRVAALVRVIVPQAFVSHTSGTPTDLRRVPVTNQASGQRLPVVIVPTSRRL